MLTRITGKTVTPIAELGDSVRALAVDDTHAYVVTEGELFRVPFAEAPGVLADLDQFCAPGTLRA